MVKNPHLLREFDDTFIRERGKPSFVEAIRLFTSMWKEGVHLGVLPPKDPLKGIEVDIKVARVVNSCLKRSLPR